jgi:hypothetical protein
MTQSKKIFAIAAVIVLLTGPYLIVHSKDRGETKQTVYVPVYSSIYHGDKDREFNLAVTVSIRNTDLQLPITIEFVDYYDTSGTIIMHYQLKAKTLKPLESVQYVVRESDTKGGIGANFIIRWRSAGPVSEPIIESVMIGTGGQQGISFTSRGVVIKQK